MVHTMNEEFYHYKESGLTNIYLANGFECVDSPYGKVVSISNVDELHLAIACDLANKKSHLTGGEFRFLRKQLNLSQNALAHLLDKTELTIHNWEHGDDGVPAMAETIIRIMFLEDKGINPKMRESLELLREIDREFHEGRVEFMNENNKWATAA